MTGDTLILFAYLEHPKTCEPFPSFRNPLNRAWSIHRRSDKASKGIHAGRGQGRTVVGQIITRLDFWQKESLNVSKEVFEGKKNYKYGYFGQRMHKRWQGVG